MSIKRQTFGVIRNEELLNSNVIDDGPTSGIVLHAGIEKRHARVVFLCLEGPRVSIPALNAVKGLQIDGLRRGWNRDVERLELRARAGRAEGDGVERAFLHLHSLADLGVVAQSHGSCALWYDQDHPALFLPGFHHLHRAVGFPARNLGGAVGNPGA